MIFWDRSQLQFVHHTDVPFLIVAAAVSIAVLKSGSATSPFQISSDSLLSHVGLYPRIANCFFIAFCAT